MTAKRERPPMPPAAACLDVVRRQLGDTPDEARWRVSTARRARQLGKDLAFSLARLAAKLECEVKDLRCDHSPALRVRAYNPRVKDVAARYTPHAHDPACLIYRPHGREFPGSHCIKTNVRGDHGQYSDVVLIKRERRREKAAATSVSAVKVRKPKRNRRAFRPPSAPLTRWPKRRFPQRPTL